VNLTVQTLVVIIEDNCVAYFS